MPSPVFRENGNRSVVRFATTWETGCEEERDDIDSNRTNERLQMVDEQIRARGVRDPAVLAAMATVPREVFVGSEWARRAYDDGPQPILEGQTISQPYVVAYMVEALRLGPRDRALEIGTGSGYAAAVLSRVAGEVWTVERHPSLARLAAWRLHRLGYRNVHVRTADGSLGWPDHGPYDGIMVSAGAPYVPQTLRTQLAVGGRLVIPVGRTRVSQDLVCVRRTGPRDWTEENLGEVRFVPLVGDAAWDDPEQPG